jgi:hypothetical protein
MIANFACASRAYAKRIRNSLSLAVAAAALLSAAADNRTSAATIALDLTCSLNGLDSSGSCSPGPVFGTITLKDLTGVDTGKVEVTVSFPGPQKFRDMMLNFAGTASTITDTDSSLNVTLSNNTYSINPYNGTFDLGKSGGQGWNTASSPYTTVLSGNVPISTSDFLALDSLGKVYAALHIQNIGSANGGTCDGNNNPACEPGMPGEGSLKIGAPDIRIVQNNVPEPSTFCLLGLAASLFGLPLRKR